MKKLRNKVNNEVGFSLHGIFLYGIDSTCIMTRTSDPLDYQYY